MEGLEPSVGVSPPASEAGASPLRHTRKVWADARRARPDRPATYHRSDSRDGSRWSYGSNSATSASRNTRNAREERDMGMPYRARINERTLLNLPGFHEGAFVYV